jgi:hypothetical protein
MWYIVPSSVPMDPTMYSMYYSRIKRLDPLVSKRKKGYVINAIQLEQMPPIKQLVQNQYLVGIPTSRLKQLVHVTRGVFVPQAMTTTLPIKIFFTIGLLVYGNGVLI